MNANCLKLPKFFADFTDLVQISSFKHLGVDSSAHGTRPFYLRPFPLSLPSNVSVSYGEMSGISVDGAAWWRRVSGMQSAWLSGRSVDGPWSNVDGIALLAGKQDAQVVRAARLVSGAAPLLLVCCFPPAQHFPERAAR